LIQVFVHVSRTSKNFKNWNHWPFEKFEMQALINWKQTGIKLESNWKHYGIKHQKPSINWNQHTGIKHQKPWNHLPMKLESILETYWIQT